MDLDINQILPLLLLTGVSNTQIALLMVLYPLLKWVYKKIQSCWYRKKVVVEINDKTDFNRSIFRTYVQISWFLKTQKLLKYPVLQLKEANYSDNTTIYKITNHEKIDFTFEKHKISFQFFLKGGGKNQSDEKAIISITADTIEIIQNFIDMVSDKHNKYQKAQRDGILIKFYEASKWTEKKSSVVKTFDNLFLSEHIRDKLLLDIKSFQSSKDLYKKMGLSYKRGFLFYGKPGCGKTSAINAIARYVDYDIYKLKISEFCDGKTLLKAVKSIPTRSILVIEDIDRFNIGNKKYTVKKDISYQFILPRVKKLRIIYDKDEGVSIPGYYSLLVNLDADLAFDLTEFLSSENDFLEKTRILLDSLSTKPDLIMDYELTDFFDVEISESEINVADLMEIFDGNEYLHKCFIIITSNYPDKLDRALIRPGRIDTHIDFTPADRKIVCDILSKFYNKTHQKVNKDLKNFNKLIEQSKLINSIILPNINDYQKALTTVLQY